MAERTVLDEAISVFERKPLGPPIVPRDYDLAAVVLRIAADRLRATAEESARRAYGRNWGYTAAGVRLAADLLTEGLDDTGDTE